MRKNAKNKVKDAKTLAEIAFAAAKDAYKKQQMVLCLDELRKAKQHFATCKVRV